MNNELYERINQSYILCVNYVFCSMTNRHTDNISYILDAHWQEKLRFQPYILKSSREFNVSPHNYTTNKDMKFCNIYLFVVLPLTSRGHALQKGVKQQMYIFKPF